MHRTRSRLKSAFTLIEVVMAMFIVAAGGMIFYGLAPTAAKTGKMIGNIQQASSVVQHKVDQLRGIGYGRLTYDEMFNAGIIDAAPNTSPYSFKTVDALGAIYPNATGTLTIADFNAKVKQVTVTLTWTGSPVRQGNGTLTVVALIPRN